MAHHGLGKMFICRRCCNDLLTPLSKSRPFTSTAQRARAIPQFSPSSNSELDDFFMTFRNEIFAPEAVSKLQRGLIYKPARQKILRGDPGVTVTMSDGEELKLQPLDIRLRPKKKKSLQRLANLLRESSDWNNLPSFLEGMQLAGEKIPAGYTERLVRRAADYDMMAVIIRCAQMVTKTGLTLAEEGVTREIMLGIHRKAAKAGFEGEQYATSVQQAQQIAMLLEKREHRGGSSNNSKALIPHHTDMWEDTTALSVLLELRAAQPDHTQGWMSFDSVPKMAARILSLWPTTIKQSLQVPQDPHEARLRMESWLPLSTGIKFALKNDKEIQQQNQQQEPGLKSGLVEARDELTRSIEEARRLLEAEAEVSSSSSSSSSSSEGQTTRRRRCLDMYDEVKDL